MGTHPDTLPTVAATPAPEVRKPGFRDAAVALKERNFALFWSGALLSSTGGWIQRATVPFVLFEMTGSATWIGFSAFLSFVPAVFMGPLGGSLSDRLPRRSVLLATQTGLAAAALVLWALFATGVATPWWIVAVVGAHGIVTGVNIPSWQAFISELVPRRSLLNAVTLNSAQFNAARALGPAAAGGIIAVWGPTAAFLVNAVSYGAVIVALLAIRVPPLPKVDRGRLRVFAEFAETARYIRERPGMAVCVKVVVLLGFLGSPVFSLVKVFTDEVFGVGDVAFGFMGAALGIGAVLGTPLVAGRGSGLARSHLAFTSVLTYGVALVVFAQAPVYAVGFVALLVAGAAYLAIASTLNTTLQLLVDETMRGKVMALYIMGLTGSMPIGSLLQGWLADVAGPRITVAVAGALFASAAFWLGTVKGLFDRMDDTGDIEAGDAGSTDAAGSAPLPAPPPAGPPTAAG